MTNQLERDKLLNRMVEALEQRDPKKFGSERHMAEICLRVIEEPARSIESADRICTCGQNGYPENHWHSNHPHAEDCPQYTGYGRSAS